MQLFSTRADGVLRWLLWAVPAVLLAAGLGGWLWIDGGAADALAIAPDQPVAFSHQHHADFLGIDCRYCHYQVERGASAGLPPTEICMGCHSQLWTDSPMLAPVRASWVDGRPLRWTRVYDLPDFVYFDHSIHVARGVGCERCHGRVDQQPLTRRSHAFWMTFCLDCHRDPAPNLRPPEAVTTMGWQAPPGYDGEAQARAMHVAPALRLTQCSICHR